MRIAVVRGPSLNPWEMENFLPLAKRHQLLLVGSKKGKYNLKIPNTKYQIPNTNEKRRVRIERLTCLGEVFNYFPGGIKFLYRFFGDPQILLRLEKVISSFDIVNTAETANYYSLQALRCRQKGLIGKVIVTCWENIAFNREDYPAQKRIKEKVRGEADHFLAVTEGAKRTLMKEGVEEERITVIPMGTKNIKYQISNIKNTNQILKILFVGRLEEEKGVWEILRAFAVLKKDYQNLRLTMVGQGSQEGKIKDWIASNNLSNWVQIKGGVGHQKIWQEYQRADIFVLASKPTPTWQEQFGMVLIEAMAAGLPIVATKSGAIPEVVGKAGILVEPGNSIKLAEALGELVANECLRKKLGEEGLRRAKEKYDSLKVAEKIERLYQKILKGI